jgi:hypothetical protein
MPYTSTTQIYVPAVFFLTRRYRLRTRRVARGWRLLKKQANDRAENETAGISRPFHFLQFGD